MKNIHILPTDKPSRLHLWTDEKGARLELCDLEYSHTRNTQNIYITSDEKIKEGDWCLDINKNIIILWSHPHTTTTPFFKKIILTTDQSLDGIQAIDDEFLEWFVKNPGCEEVDIDKINLCTQTGLPCGMQCLSEETCNENISYKIIIPKEEVFEMYSHLYGKTVTMDDRFETKHIWSEELSLKNKGRWIPQEEPKQECTCGVCDNCEEKESIQILKEAKENALKQETLEEAAERIYGTDMDSYRGSIVRDQNIDLKRGFVKGAKWQMERMYSEEDMKQFAFECVGKFLSNDDNKVEIKLVDVIIDRLNKHFEQFKKK